MSLLKRIIANLQKCEYGRNMSKLLRCDNKLEIITEPIYN